MISPILKGLRTLTLRFSKHSLRILFDIFYAIRKQDSASRLFGKSFLDPSASSILEIMPTGIYFLFVIIIEINKQEYIQ